MTELFIEDDDEPVDLLTARMKCVSGRWIVQLYEHLEDNPQIIVHGFHHAGIYDALRLIDEDDDLPEYPTSDDDYDDESDTDIDILVRNEKRQLSVLDVYSDSQSEEEVVPHTAQTARCIQSDDPIILSLD